MLDQNVIGAIDIGSNAIRMICARLTEDYRIEELEKNRTPIRLGEDVFRIGYITEERIEQLLATIRSRSTRKPWNRTTAKKSVPTAPVPSGNQETGRR